jgi:hypothetical protein
MTVTITITRDADAFSNTFTQDWDDATVDRMIEWAKNAYPNDDGTLPGRGAACNRASKAVVQGWRDNIRRFEAQEDIAALPPPPPIDVDVVG